MGKTNLTYFSDTLHNAIPLLNPQERAHLLAMHAHYLAQFRQHMRSDRVSTAYSVHLLIDDRLAETVAKSPHGPDVKCHRGCDACCHLQVGISDPEARLAVSFAAEQGVSLDLDLLARQRGLSASQWAELPKADRRCVFLGSEGQCRVYEHRPDACRKYLVVTDPKWCDVIEHPGHEVGRLFSMEAEVIDSAAMTAALPGVGVMADMVQRVLEEEKL